MNLPIRNCCTDCAILKNSFFSDCFNEEDLELLERSKKSIAFKKGDHIIKQGTKSFDIACLSLGKIKKVVENEHSNDKLIGIIQSLSFLNLDAILNATNNQFSMIAMTDCNICYIDGTAFNNITNNNADVSKRLLQFVLEEVNSQHNLLAEISDKNLRGRMATILVYISKIFGKIDSNQNIMIDYEFKRRDLADFSNMAVSNGIRVINDFKREGLVHVDKRIITILNLKTLEDISKNIF